MKKITTPQLLEALVEQRETGRKLGEILIDRCYVSREDVEAALRSQGTNRLTDTKADADADAVYWRQSSPYGVLDYLLALGARKRASDVSLEPQGEQVAVRYRIDGFSFRVDPVPKSLEASLERALFAMFGLDPARRARAQSGRTTARLGEDDFDLVLQTVPGPQGLSATIKLVNRATFIKDFMTLGLETGTGRCRRDPARLRPHSRHAPAFNGAVTRRDHGLLAQSQKDVLSIESPVQWTMDGVRQVEAEKGPQGPRVEETLRAMVAVRPDVLMLFSIPDYGTALLASQLASSLLVVGRTTAGGAARGLVALRELGVPAPLLAGSLALVLSQRLVRSICRICQVPAEPPAAQTLAAHGIDRGEASPGLLQGGLPELQHDRFVRGRVRALQVSPAG
jgi:type II secretory ATPase GspE/PulE/Tfp pilus assembly ATPase PilB-like protein